MASGRAILGFMRPGTEHIWAAGAGKPSQRERKLLFEFIDIVAEYVHIDDYARRRHPCRWLGREERHVVVRMGHRERNIGRATKAERCTLR